MKIVEKIVGSLNLSETKQKVLSNVIWSLLGKVINLFGNLFVGIIIARYLGPKDYGLMNYVISFVTLFQIISSLGLDNIEVREEAKKDVPPDVIMGTSFRIRIVLSILTVILTITTAFIYEADSITIVYIAIYSLSVIAKSLDVIRNRFTSLVQNKYVVKSEISRTFIGMVIKIGLLLVNASLIWFIVAITLDFFLLAGGYVFSYHQQIGIMRKWKYNKEYGRFLIKEAFPLLLTGTAVFIYQRIDQVMIGNLVDKSDKTAVGYFATASRFVEILMFFPQIFVHTVVPILVSIRKENKEKYKVKVQQFFNVNIWASIIFSLLLSVTAYWVIIFTFGAEYENAVPVLQILSFKAAAFAVSTTAGGVLVLEGLQKFAIVRDLTGCVVCLSLNYFLLPYYGITAAAYISILSLVCAGYIANLFVPSYHHLFRYQTKALLTGWKDIVHFKQLIKR